MKMKNKKAEQTASKEKHKELLKNKRRCEPLLQRNVPAKIERPTILIVCEGENTEPSYFKRFKLSSATTIAIGEGYNTLSLVKRAKVLSENKDNNKKIKQYEQVWCVFDADPKSDNTKHALDFNRAIALAKKYGFGIAYSNQAFEYWIILHLEDHQGGRMNRNDYNKKINHYLNPHRLSYDGDTNKLITENIFEFLEGKDEKTKKERRVLAIERAKRNYDRFDHTNPSNEESSTTVFKLVEELIKYI